MATLTHNELYYPRKRGNEVSTLDTTGNKEKRSDAGAVLDEKLSAPPIRSSGVEHDGLLGQSCAAMASHQRLLGGTFPSGVRIYSSRVCTRKPSFKYLQESVPNMNELIKTERKAYGCPRTARGTHTVQGTNGKLWRPQGERVMNEPRVSHRFLNHSTF